MNDGMVESLFVGGVLQSMLFVLSGVVLSGASLVQFGREFLRTRRMSVLVAALIAALSLLVWLVLIATILRPGSVGFIAVIAPLLFIPVVLLVAIGLAYFGRRLARSGGWLEATAFAMALFIGSTEALLLLEMIGLPLPLLALTALVALIVVEVGVFFKMQPAKSGRGGAMALVLVVMVVSLLLPAAVGASARIAVTGQSMEPALHFGDYVLLRKEGFEPKRGDIVVLAVGVGQQRRDYISRVVGLPGETLEVRQGQVWIDGKALDEPYPVIPARYSTPSVKIGQGQIFILGDNRPNAADSHILGPVPSASLVGKALIRYWPPARWGALPFDE